jgi:hypothetical protein
MKCGIGPVLRRLLAATRINGRQPGLSCPECSTPTNLRHKTALQPDERRSCHQSISGKQQISPAEGGNAINGGSRLSAREMN